MNSGAEVANRNHTNVSDPATFDAGLITPEAGALEPIERSEMSARRGRSFLTAMHAGRRAGSPTAITYYLVTLLVLSPPSAGRPATGRGHGHGSRLRRWPYRPA